MINKSRWIKSAMLAAAFAACSAGAALAHHAFAMFDRTKTLALKGQVIEFQWTNPHAWIEVGVTGVRRCGSYNAKTGKPVESTCRYDANGDPIYSAYLGAQLPEAPGAPPARST